ncbi:Ig-like domain-containing protein, partial [Verminephrobacter aporrectodeae]
MSTQLNITLANSRLKAGETTTVTFAFNEAVTGFTRDDVVLSDANGTLGEPTTSDNGRTWTATFTPTANVEDSSNTISVNLAGVTNTAGTAGSGQASSTNYGIDTRRPTVVAITVADMHLGIGETTTVTFTFSEAVTDLVLNDLYYLYANWRMLSCSDPRPSGTSRTIWTATATPLANGDCNIGVDMRTVTDLAGNAGLERTVTNDSRVIVDLVRPTAASTNPITFADTDLGLGETTTVTFRFSEAISGFTLDDIDLSQAHGTLSGLRSTSGDGSSGDTWTALFTPTANTTSLTNTLAINLSGVRDIAGNAGQGSVRSDNYTVKTQPPTATITLANSRIKAGETTAVTFTFSEAVTGFTRDDVVLSDANGTLGEPTTSDNGTTWTATFTPTANVEDSSNTIRVNLAGVTNTAGTAGSGQASSTNYGIDTRRPTVVAITVADMHLGIGETTTITFTFSEAVTDLVLNDLYYLYANWRMLSCSDPRPSGTSRTIWTATATPLANGDCNIGVDMRTVTDLAGNAGLGKTVTNDSRVIVDLVRPTAASTNPITLADTDLGLGETTTVTFRFSEAISGFTLDDIDLSQAHGTLSGLRSTSGDGSSGDTWTALFTPTANTTSLTNTIAINLAGVRDIAGNAGQGSVRSGNYAVKTQGLTATITLADTALAAGETTTVTFTFSETVTGFTREDIVFDATTGTLGEPTTSDNGTTWTATFTPTANANTATNTIRVNLAGVNTAAGTAGTGTASSDNFIVDSTPPVINTTTVNGNQLVLTYTEANSLDGTALAGNAGFTVSSTTGTAIAVNSAEVHATNKTVTLTLSRAVAQGEAVSLSYTKPATGAVVQDAAGNDAADFSSRAVTNNTPDTTPPQLITTGGGYQAPAISGYTGDLVLRFNDASNLNEDPARKPAAGDFTVLVDGVARTVTDVSVSAIANLITLSLATPVTHGQRVTVAYQDSTPNDTNGIQDTAGNLLTSIPTTAVLNALPDTTAPALSTATVNGNQLVLTYTDTSSLNGATLAGNAGFTVSSATGAAIAVDSAVVHATNKTVTLTLSRTVANGETVTISYAKPATGNGVQDTAHNNAADFSSRTVIN